MTIGGEQVTRGTVAPEPLIDWDRLLDRPRVPVEVGGDALEPPGTVEHARPEPHRMAAGADDRDIAFVPVAIDIGPRLARRRGRQ